MLIYSVHHGNSLRNFVSVPYCCVCFRKSLQFRTGLFSWLDDSFQEQKGLHQAVAEDFCFFLAPRGILNLSWELRGAHLLSRTMHPRARIHADPAPEFDQFDCLPDPVVLLILNKLEDVRSLGRCAAVSKRFSGLVPLVSDVYVRIDRVVATDGDADDALNLSSAKPKNIFSHFFKLMLFTIVKPFHSMRNPNGTGRPLFPLAQHSPVHVLRNFSDVWNLRVELPSGDVGTEEGVLLKWRAEYGSTLRNCVILGGTLVDRKPISAEHESLVEDNGSMPESFYTNGGLKLRVVWTISSLIAASTRHYLLQSIIKDHPTLRSLVLADADGQGTLYMGMEQLREFRENKLSASACSNRTQVPACNMKLKYAPYLELPGGMALQGATLVVIKPSNDGGSGGHNSRKETEAFVSSAFDEPFRFAVKALMKRRTYLLEMNGF